MFRFFKKLNEKLKIAFQQKSKMNLYDIPKDVRIFMFEKFPTTDYISATSCCQKFLRERRKRIYDEHQEQFIKRQKRLKFRKTMQETSDKMGDIFGKNSMLGKVTKKLINSDSMFSMMEKSDRND